MAAMQVSWWVELALRPGCLEDFAKLTGEMVASAQAENGVLAYQRFISEDRQTVYVHERYEDSGAAIEHLRAFIATFDEQYASMVERRRFVVFGDPSDELRALLNGMELHITGLSGHSLIGGDHRWPIIHHIEP
jgi:quinol monooxygenase YgiN